MSKIIKIQKRKIGKGYLPLIVPELGINHGGNLELAIHMADLAFKCGAEIVKNQTHIPDMEMAPIAKNIKPGNSNKNIFEIIKKNSLSENDEKTFTKNIKSKKKYF